MDQQNKSIKAAVIGLGVGEQHLKGYLSVPGCEVAAVCDIDPERLSKVANDYPGIPTTPNADDILLAQDIDVVSIATNDEFHYEQIMKGVEANKHIFVEKPLCVSRQQLCDIKLAFEKKPHLQLSSNLVLRKAPRFEQLSQRLGNGELGDLYYLEGAYDYGRLEKLTNGWRGLEQSYSVMLGGGIHLIDLILWLHKVKVRKVSAIGTNIASNGTAFNGFDMVLSTIVFEDGSIGKISANFGSVTKHHHRLSIYGTTGTFSQSHDGATYHFGRDAAPKEVPLVDEYPGVKKDKILQGFILALQGKCTMEISKDEIFDAMNVALAIDEALKSETTIEL